jgi:trimeric autotransporter adhesin
MKIQARSILIVFPLICLAAAVPTPRAFGVVPAPDGCYPNYTTAEGCNALSLLTTGLGNTGVGWYSLFSNTDASYNTAVGAGTLVLNDGDSNTALGAAALLLNTSGTENTAIGTDAMVYNDTGIQNTVIGAFALFSNTEGSFNTGVGEAALFSNTTGDQNTAIGYSALRSNIDGTLNTATGFHALITNENGSFNTANGYNALRLNIGGSDNTAIGTQALFHNTTGGENTALGESAGFSQTTGSGNVYIGTGVPGVDGESNACYIASIFGQTSSVGIPVLVNANHKLGTTTSSKRFKEDIKPMNTASETLFALKPVSFRYKKDIDPTGIPQLGLVAEDVEEVNPNLVVRDKEGQPYSVRYDAVNAMLLNEFLKEHKKVKEQGRTLENQADKIQEQEATIIQLKNEMATVVAHLKEHDAKIQTVNDRIEFTKPVRQVVANNE